MPTPRRPSTARLATSAAALLFTALSGQSAWAISILAAGAQVCEFDRYRSQGCTGDSVYSATGPVTKEASLPGQHAYASMDYGVFKGSADASIASGSVLLTGPFNLRNVATGTSWDTWVIGGGTGQGYLRFTWAIDGTTSSTSGSPYGGGTYSDAYLQIDAHVNAQTYGSGSLQSDVTTGAIHGGAGNYEMSGPVAFVFDRPMEVVFGGFVFASLGANNDYVGPLYGGEAHADFSHTAILTGVQVYDANDHLLSSATISAESGTQYPLATAVPEPGSVALMLAGLGAVAWLQRRPRAGGKTAGR